MDESAAGNQSGGCILSRFLLLIVEAAVDSFNDAVFEHKKERREAGLKRHERGRKRKILTSIGPLYLRSDVYYDTDQKNTPRS